MDSREIFEAAKRYMQAEDLEAMGKLNLVDCMLTQPPRIVPNLNGVVELSTPRPAGTDPTTNTDFPECE